MEGVKKKTNKKDSKVSDNSNLEKIAESNTLVSAQDSIVKEGMICPTCKSGIVIKGKTAYGCSRWKEGCDFRVPFQ